MKDVVKKWLEKGKAKKLDSVSLSATSEKRRIVDKSHDVLEQIVSQVNASPFYTIQLDEFIDISGLPHYCSFLYLLAASLMGKY